MKKDKQSTALQQLIDKFNEAKENFPGIGFDEEFIRGFNKAFQMAVFITDQFGKPIERKQIEDAYKSGLPASDRVEYSNNIDDWASDYFTTTFKQ